MMNTAKPFVSTAKSAVRDTGRSSVATAVVPVTEIHGGAVDKPRVPEDSASEFVGHLSNQNKLFSLIGDGHGIDVTLKKVTNAIFEEWKASYCAIVFTEAGSQTSMCYAVPEHASAMTAALTAESFSPLETTATEIQVHDPAKGSHPLFFTARDCGYKTIWSCTIETETGNLTGHIYLCFEDVRQPTELDRNIFLSWSAQAKLCFEIDRQMKELTSANERFTSLAAAIPGVVYQRKVTPEGDIRYTYISEAAKDLFGVEPAKILSDPQALFDHYGEEYYATFRNRLIEASKELKTWDVEAEIIKPNGERKFTHAIARPHRESDGTVVWNGVILDASRIKEAEVAAAEAESRTREIIVESINQGIVLYDADGRLVTCNSHFIDLYPDLSPLIESGATYASMMRAEVEADHSAKESDAEISERLADRLSQHECGEYVSERQLGDGRWILVNEHKTKDGSVVVLYTDVTELKLREMALERSNQELSDFAHVASHDLQEPLRKIEAFGDRLMDKCGDDLSDQGKMYLDRIHSASGRMRQLINDLLSFSRVTTKAQPFSWIDLEKIVRDVLSDLQIAIEEADAAIELEGLGEIHADPLQMRMLLQNLISNAIKFRKPDRPCRIEVIGRNLGKADGKQIDHCEIIVADNGIGFDEKHADRIFGIFQRLHGREEFEGTGIGLATCKKIAQRHQGTILAKSTPGEGSQFVVTIPAAQIG